MRLSQILVLLIITILLECPLPAQDEHSTSRWDFSTAESETLTPHGNVQFNQAGPVPPEFPSFDKENKAIRLDGKGAYLSVKDPGENSSFDFTNGETITLEAWVKLDKLRDNQIYYVIGKGRTHAPGFSRENQNWAMRVVGSSDGARLGFLFSSQPESGAVSWHRWTSNSQLEAIQGWHHIAITYTYGKPDSIKGWIDGLTTKGTWDLNGPTTQAPVVDDDEVWIGSSMGGNPGSSLTGMIDEVAIHRVRLNDQAVASRFNRVGGPRVSSPLPETMPVFKEIPAGKVLVTFSEGMATHTRWFNRSDKPLSETFRWVGDEFLLPRIPLRYDAWGIRDSWKSPVLLRFAADVELPYGKHRFMMRARGLGRLWLDGEVIARTTAMTTVPPNGEEAITPLAQPPHPGLRIKDYHAQEVFVDVLFLDATNNHKPARHRIVVEMVIGGKGQRTETGEVCVAIESEDGKSFFVLRPDQKTNLPLTDAAILPVLTQIENKLSAIDDQTRQQAAATQDQFWNKRHQIAQDWSAKHPAPEVPKVANHKTGHQIDRFLVQKVRLAQQAASASDPKQSQHFHSVVLPILRENCFRCHGEKDKGGLRLNTLENALNNGDSDLPAIVPGDIASSELVERIRSDDEDLRMPPTEGGLKPDHIEILETWIKSGANWPAPPLDASQIELSSVVNDQTFLRRLYLDTVGVPPTAREAAQFLSDTDANKRIKLIDRLLSDDRFADHWVSYWMDLLAENPSLLNASLNSTGPFRWFLHDSLRDNKPLDRFVTELLLMRGSLHEGGSAGFSIAAENDSPFAAKGHIVASAFLGIELQCARCHDSPYHSTTQHDLYSLAAMFSRKPVKVPATSRVPAGFFEEKTRESLIQVTLKPEESIPAKWPFAETTGATDGPEIDLLMHDPKDSRERLATLITSSTNQRFSRVIVNRIWKQLIGAGLVEPVHDWEGRNISHPELLDWLSQELLTHHYDFKHIIRLIVSSRLYQSEATGKNLVASADVRFFNAPQRRRLTAEQIVDSMHISTGVAMNVEEMTFVHDGRREPNNRLTLGKPKRAWMLADLKNERDRPSLSLPYARSVTDVLEAFGWTGARQKPIMHRETDPNVLQPGVLANGTLSAILTRASINSDLAELAVNGKSPQEIVQTLFLRILSRYPNANEQEVFTQALTHGFETRLLSPDQMVAIKKHAPLPQVTWFNHGQSEANTIQLEIERRVRQGPAPDPRLNTKWREVYEDIVWSLINHREFVWIP